VARPENPSLIYLDSNTIISVIKAEAGHEPVAEILRLADAGRLTIAISMVSFVEVRGTSRSEPYSPEKDRQAIEALSGPHVLTVELHRHVALLARKLGMERGLKTYDAIHLASAIEAEADVLMTNDTKFPVGTFVQGVWVDKPYAPGDPLLFN
jgi:predicted nucleic acid-binding protein